MTTATKASPITRHYFGDASGVDLTTMPATFREDCARLVSLGARGVSFAPVGGDGLPLRGSRWVSGPVGSTYYRIDFAALAKARPEAV